MREAGWEALAILWHETDEQMAHSQYRHFQYRAEEGVEAVVLLAGDHDLMGCFTDQVKLTSALIWDLDEVIKEVKLLGEHEESSQKITELEALCKKLREDTQRLEEEKATLEGMVKSHDELLMENARETGLYRMGEDAEDEEEDEDVDDGGDDAASPAIVAPPPVPPAAAPEEVDDEGLVEMIPSKKPSAAQSHLCSAELRCRSSVSTMDSWGTMRRTRSGWRVTLMILMMTRMKAALTWMSDFSKMGVMIGIESSSISVKFWLKNKFLGFT
jgi:hypothetical protein